MSETVVAAPRTGYARTLAMTTMSALACLAGVTLATSAPALALGTHHGGHHRARVRARSEAGRAFEPAGAPALGAPADAVGASASQPCNGERVPPFSACVAPYAVSAAEDHLLAGYGEAAEGTSATVCVYLSTWKHSSWVWNGSPVNCNEQPVIYTLGYTGQPTIYNDTGRWIAAGFADLH